MEALSYFIRKDLEGGFIKAFKVGKRGGEEIEILHLFFCI